jgi:hypothetical protein
VKFSLIYGINARVAYFIQTYILIEKGDENTGLSPIHMIYWGNFNWFDSEQEFG